MGSDGSIRRLDFRLLGPLEVQREGWPVPLGGGKQRMLLALLLLRANEVVPRDVLIADLFGGAASEAAANALQAGVSRLRRSLGADVISTRPAGYMLVAEPDQIDLFRFEQLTERGREELAAGRAGRAAATLREALALWRGSPLQDVGGDAVEAEVRRLEELRLAATIDRVDADLALGRGADLVPELKTLTADHPYQERLHGQLMLALYRAGRQTEALEVYRATRRLLVEELGIEPAGALQRLERAILVHDPSLAPSRPVAPVERREAGQGREAGRRRPRLALAVAALFSVTVVVSFLLAHRGGTAVTRLGPDRLGVIDPRSGRFVDSVAVGTDVTSIEAGDAVVWAASETADVAVRIAAKTRMVKTIGLPVAPAALAVARDAVWVVGDGKLVGIDVRRNQPLDPVVIAPPWARLTIAVGLGGVWATHQARLEVDRLDPGAGRVQRVFPIYPGGIGGNGQAAIAVGVGAVWASNRTELLSSHPGFLARIDPRSRDVTGSLRLSAAPFALAIGFGSVWATLADSGVVARIDPNKMAVSHTISVGRHPIALAVGEGAVWVASDGDDTISRIDPTTERVTKTIHLERSPAAPAGAANADIYAINADGSGLVQLTNATGNDRYPAWSPDGTRIVFESERTGVNQVWVMNADGSSQTQLTFDSTPKDQTPDWSPDGSRIVYATFTTPPAGGQVWVMNADGSDRHAITSGPRDYGPVWSPDGTEIALLDLTHAPVVRDVVVINADGSGRYVVHHDGPQFVPAWQPHPADEDE